MNSWIQSLVTIITTLIASSGLWSFFQKRSESKDINRLMLIGLGHDRIIALGMSYIERGNWITQDEYENLVDYLYKPYTMIGGNGTAERLIRDIDNKLKIVKEPPQNKEVKKDETK